MGVLAASGIGLLLALGGAPAAMADDPAVLTFDAPTSQTVEYGIDWSFNATASNALWLIGPWTATCSVSPAPAGYAPFCYVFKKDDTTQSAYVASSGALPPGTYAVNLSVNSQMSTPTPATTPATLIVQPAKLGITLKLAADVSNPRNAVVSADLTGKLIDSAGGEGGTDLGSISPAGTWKISIVDSGGTVVQELTADRKAGGWNTAVSFSWPDVAAGDYKATATFTPSGASATNYTISPSAAVDFAAPGAAPGDESTASPAPSEAAAAADSGPSVPGWILLAAAVLSLGLLALVIVQIVQLARLRGPRAAADPAHVTTEGGLQ